MNIRRLNGTEEWGALLADLQRAPCDLLLWDQQPAPDVHTALALYDATHVTVGVRLPLLESTARLAAFCREYDVEGLMLVFAHASDVRRAHYWLRPTRAYGLTAGNPDDAPGTWISIE